jgi:DNA mismatch repair protein MutL
VPLSALLPLERTGLPQAPRWRSSRIFETVAATAASGAELGNADSAAAEVEETVKGKGEVKLHGFVSRPEIQKLNRNSIFIFVNGRLIRDRVVQHAITEAYRNIIPPAVYPVVLLFLEMPPTEVDVNVHPSKTEVRFRQSSVLHDFIRDSVRAMLMKSRPVPSFMTEIHASPNASPALTPGARDFSSSELEISEADAAFALRPQTFQGAAAETALTAVAHHCAPELNDDDAPAGLASLATLKPVGQIRDSFILAINAEGLWIIDQHVAHERILFEKISKQRLAESPERQQLLMPLIVELTLPQMAVFTEISDELRHNGFEVEPFGSRTIAVKTTFAGIAASEVEHLLHEILEQFEREEQSLNLEKIRINIAASIACHAAIKVNMPLEQNKMEWLLGELAKTDCPMSCPHGRPVVLRYSVKDIQKAFKRI